MSFPVPLPSTFMPLPLAIMIPFMGIQSGVMAQQFGMNFQYGKRKISAMSNEEFNKLTPEQMQADFSTQIKGMIPTFEKSLQDMRPFQRMIFVEMLAVLKTAVELGIDVAKAGVDPLAHIFGQHIHGVGPGGQADVPVASPQIPSPTNVPSPQPEFAPPGTTQALNVKHFINVKIVILKSGFNEFHTFKGEISLLELNNLIIQYEKVSASLGSSKHISAVNVRNSLILLKNIRKRLWNVALS